MSNARIKKTGEIKAFFPTTQSGYKGYVDTDGRFYYPEQLDFRNGGELVGGNEIPTYVFKIMVKAGYNQEKPPTLNEALSWILFKFNAWIAVRPRWMTKLSETSWTEEARQTLMWEVESYNITSRAPGDGYCNRFAIFSESCDLDKVDIYGVEVCESIWNLGYNTWQEAIFAGMVRTIKWLTDV